MASTLVTDAYRLGLLTNGNSVTNMPINLASDPLYIILVSSTGDAVTDANKRAVTYEGDANCIGTAGYEVSGTGYTARGQALGSLSCTQTTQVVTFTSANAVWSAATITALGCWLVKHESTAGASPCIGFWDFGGTITSTAAAFTVAVNASGWLTCSGG